MLRYLLPMFLTEKKRKKSANNFSNKLETPLFATRSSRIGGDIHASEKKKKEKERKEKIKKKRGRERARGGKVDDDSSGKELGRERGTGKRRQTEAEAQTETIDSFVLQFRAL